MNRYVIYIFLIQACLAGSLAICYMILYYTGFNKYKDYIYPDHDGNEYIYQTFFVVTLIWSINFTNFVPISLLVTMEMIKFFQGMFM